MILKKICEAMIWCIMGAVLVFSPIARGTVDIWSAAPVIIALFCAGLLTISGNRPAKWSDIDGISWLALVFFMLAAISCVFSIYKHASFYAMLKLLGYLMVFYVIRSNYSDRTGKAVIWTVICAGTALSAYGLAQYFNFMPHSWWAPSGLLASTYVNHNHFSGYLELAIPAAVGIMIGDSSVNHGARVAAGTAVIVMAAAFMFAQSRGAWISLGCSLLVMSAILTKTQRPRRRGRILLIFSIITFLSCAYLSRDMVPSHGDSIKRNQKRNEASLEVRVMIWRGTLKMICDNPVIGTGIGTFVWGFSRYRPEGLNARAHYAHNDYLHMAAEMGLLAPVLMLCLIISIVSKGVNAAACPMIQGCAIGVMSLALHGLIDFNFHIPANMIVTAAYAALISEEGKRRS